MALKTLKRPRRRHNGRLWRTDRDSQDCYCVCPGDCLQTDPGKALCSQCQSCADVDADGVCTPTHLTVSFDGISVCGGAGVCVEMYGLYVKISGDLDDVFCVEHQGGCVWFIEEASGLTVSVHALADCSDSTYTVSDVVDRIYIGSGPFIQRGLRFTFDDGIQPVTQELVLFLRGDWPDEWCRNGAVVANDLASGDCYAGGVDYDFGYGGTATVARCCAS